MLYEYSKFGLELGALEDQSEEYGDERHSAR
jgi:hypothetical protein